MEADGDERLYQCARKFDKMVKQFEGLMEMVDTRTNLLKRRRITSSPRRGRPGSASGGSKSGRGTRRSSNSIHATESHENDLHILVHTITNHLNDLNNDHLSDVVRVTVTDN